MKSFLQEIRQELKKHSDERYKEGASNYFKGTITLHGVRLPVVRKIARDYFKQIKDKKLSEILSLSEELLKTGYFEEMIIGIQFSYMARKQFTPSDFKTIERWLNAYVSNWAHCDDLCNHTVGYFIETFPEVIPRIKTWTSSKNKWVRRAAAVSFVLPARKGENLEDVFEIADALLLDNDDMVQKGYGWMLKETSKKHQKEVFDYIIKNKNKMPRVALRYAIEKMPDSFKKKAMQKD